MAHRKISLACNIHCHLIFFFNFFWLISMSMLWRICAYVHISDRVHLCMSYCCYHLILSVKHFYTNQIGAKGWLDIYHLVPAWQWLGEYDMIWYDIWYDIFLNCNWVATWWQYYSTHLHTNNRQNNTKQKIPRTTQK
jgi:hypothetical protein